MSSARWHIPSSEEELIDVFYEEAKELLENMDISLAAWRKDLDNTTALSEIRRGFHTLKGSGRMVKALDLADVAWRVENMLNQAIAGTIPCSVFMVKLVASVRVQMPRMLDAMKNRRSVAKNSDIMSLMKRADAIAAGKAATGKSSTFASPPVPVAITGSKQQLKPSELNLKLERFMQRADEALHRSEMALQQARRTSGQIDALHVAVTQPEWRSEVHQIAERVNLLYKKLSELHSWSSDNKTGSRLHMSEISHQVNTQVRKSLAPTELLLNEIKWDIEDNRRKVNAGGRVGWVSLVYSATLGGIISSGLMMLALSLG